MADDSDKDRNNGLLILGLAGVAIGIAYFFNPRRGASRRASFTEFLDATAREVIDRTLSGPAPVLPAVPRKLSPAARAIATAVGGGLTVYGYRQRKPLEDGETQPSLTRQLLALTGVGRVFGG